MTPAVLAALAPVVLLIALGVGLRRRRFLPEAFWAGAERLGYTVLLPALFVHGLATARLEALPVWALGGTVAGATAATAGLALLLRPWLGADGPAFTSIFQGAIRFNNYVGVTVAAGLYGAEGVALAAVCNAAIVPTANLLCVLVFARHGTARLDARGIARQLGTNPLILSCGLGIALQAGRVPLPPGVDGALRALGAASLPLGLLCVGAALEFGGARRWFGPVLAASVLKFGALPGAAAGLGLAFGLSGPAFAVALLFAAMPTASSAFILARQLGGDAPLMAGITAAQTLLAAAAIPAALALGAWLAGMP